MANIFFESHSIVLKRGDSWNYEIPVTDSNNQAFDFTGWTNFKSQVRTQADATNVTIEFTGATIDVVTGIITLIADTAATTLLTPNVYTYDIQADLPSGQLITFIGGTFEITTDVTR